MREKKNLHTYTPTTVRTKKRRHHTHTHTLSEVRIYLYIYILSLCIRRFCGVTLNESEIPCTLNDRKSDTQADGPIHAKKKHKFTVILVNVTVTATSFDFDRIAMHRVCVCVQRLLSFFGGDCCLMSGIYAIRNQIERWFHTDRQIPTYISA